MMPISMVILILLLIVKKITSVTLAIIHLILEFEYIDSVSLLHITK